MRVDQIGVAGRAPQSKRNHRHLRRRQQPTAQLAQTPQHLNIGVHRANDGALGAQTAFQHLHLGRNAAGPRVMRTKDADRQPGEACLRCLSGHVRLQPVRIIQRGRSAGRFSRRTRRWLPRLAPAAPRSVPGTWATTKPRARPAQPQATTLRPFPESRTTPASATAAGSR